MSEASRVSRLVRGGELLAELVVTDGDFPWLNAEVRPAAGFAEVRPLFAGELQRLEFLDGEPEQWEAAYRRIPEVVRLPAPAGRPVPEFLLHIEGEDAWRDGVMNRSRRGRRAVTASSASAADSGCSSSGITSSRWRGPGLCHLRPAGHPQRRAALPG
jgi:hypothetical protein